MAGYPAHPWYQHGYLAFSEKGIYVVMILIKYGQISGTPLVSTQLYVGIYAVIIYIKFGRIYVLLLVSTELHLWLPRKDISVVFYQISNIKLVHKFEKKN